MFDRFSHVMLYVADMDRALAFYKDKLGFGAHFEDPHYSSLFHPAMQCRLDLHPVPADGKDAGRAPIPYFTSSRLDEVVQELQARGVKTGKVKSEGGTRFVSFWDSEGNELGVEAARG